MTGIAIDAREEGQGGSTILWVHGFSSGPEDWSSQTAYFADRFRNIAVALRGHGASPRGDANMTIEQLSDDCLAALHARAVAAPVYVAGHSMGTRIALEMARKAPDLVTGLILVDGSNTAQAGEVAALKAFDESVAASGYQAFARGLFEAMFFDETNRALSSRLVERALSMREDTARSLYRNMIRWDGQHAANAMQDAHARGLPVLIIQSTTRGADQARRTLAAGETGAYEAFVTSNIRDAMIVPMPGYGHFVTYEDPDGVNTAIDNWLMAQTP